MIDLIRKRHEGEGWCVFEELANGTGYKVRGWADAAALGIWPSRGYELHGYEFKISREDLKKELRDPQKADNVGKYCHYWWLVLSEEKLMDGLAIPEAWGILVPRGRILRTIRKAPKIAKPKPFDPAFCAAMIRNITKTWVPKHVHEEFKENVTAHARAELERERKYRAEDAEHELKALKGSIALFEQESGLEIITKQGWVRSSYQLTELGKAVKAVLAVRDSAGGLPSTLTAEQAIRHELEQLERAADRHETSAAALRAGRDRALKVLGLDGPDLVGRDKAAG